MSTVYGWVTEAEADDYMDARLGASEHWTSATDKVAALTTAYNCIVLDGRWDFTLESGEDYPEAWVLAQCEQALFLLANPDLEARINLQAQGVIQAGIVQETYRGGDKYPIAPRAVKALQAYLDEDHNVLTWE